MFRHRDEQKVRQLGFDPARLPSGQKITEKWPILHAGSVPAVDLESWTFRVFGEVESPVELTYEELQSLPTVEATIDIHCVTRWSRFDTRFRGVQWDELASIVRPRQAAEHVIAHAEQRYTTNVPLSALEDQGAMVAWEADGEALTPDHGWPLRLIVPSRYFWKSAKWLRALELTAVDQPGFWERGGYHNNADPWSEERYGF